MEALSVIGGALLPPLFESLFKQLPGILNYTRKDFQVHSQLQKWDTMLKAIHSLLDDSEDCRHTTNQSLKFWLTQIRDLAYDIEDVLDQFSAEAQGSGDGGNMKRSSNKVLSKLMPCCSCGLQFSGVRFSVDLVLKLERITSRLEEIIGQKDFLNMSKNGGGRRDVARERVALAPALTSLVDEAKVYGREKDKEAVIELLKGGGDDDVEMCVVCIVGMGGVGKTTLASLVFNDERLEFDLRVWVSVGEEFDVFRMTKMVLQSIGEDFSAEGLNLLQVKLEKKLSGKKVLIVLDDVWNENYYHWTLFSCPFKATAKGSRMVVTTRLQSVSAMMGTYSSPYILQELSYDDCLLVFAQHALGARNFDAHFDLKGIGEEIVKRCQGLPLAAKALGGLLRGKPNHSSWEKVLKNKIWELPEEKNGIIPALRLSYYHLPSHLKRCFAYCAIFPKDSGFSKDALVFLWMAEGFIQPSRDQMMVKDLGYEFFLELLARSLFQPSNENESLYAMHDLISDLARSVSGEICFNLDDEGEGAKSYAQIRHAAFTPHHYDIAQRFEIFNEMKSLRTLITLPILGAQEHNLSSKVLNELVPKLECLRVLSLSHYNIVELPSSIGALKLLRYLNISCTQIERLPESVGKLINLQTLTLRGCQKLIELPASLSNLIKLQFLDISGTPRLQNMPSIGKLANLQTLTKFIVGNGNGCEITDLMKFSHLQGELHLSGLHNVVDIRDVDRAIMREKHGLEELVFEWTNDFEGLRNGRDELQVLKALQPQKDLVSLQIKSYGGTTFPSWIGNPLFSNMVFVEFCNCRNVSSLPPLGQLASLKNLNIKGLVSIKEVGLEFYGRDSSCVDVFPSLKTLKFEDMLQWKEWYCSDALNEDNEGMFPNLHKITMKNCPSFIGNFPRHLRSLKELNICHCPQLERLPEMLPSLDKLIVEECKEVLFRRLPNLASLTAFTVKKIAGLISLNEAFMNGWTALEVMEITDCDELTYLWEDGIDLGKLACLRRLVIVNCEQLVCLVKGEEGLLPYDLQVLEIYSCGNFEKLPNGLHRATSLKDLMIYLCAKLVSFPATGLPSCLKTLEIKYCDSLQSLPYGIMQSDDNNNEMPYLERLQIFECPSLTSFPIGEFPISLKSLSICHVTEELLPSIQSIPHLTELEISDCPELVLFPESGLLIPSLGSLVIWDLQCLPTQMDNFVSLRSLEIRDCEGLMCIPEGGLPPNLSTLKIWECNNLTQPMSEWGLHRLTSLKRLQIVGNIPAADMVSFPDDSGLLLPISITFIDIGQFENLKSISRGISKLTSLKFFWIWNCPEIRSLPKEGFPDTLGCLGIDACPLLEERCTKGRGDYWPIIAHIPCIRINFSEETGVETRNLACFDFHAQYLQDYLT